MGPQNELIVNQLSGLADAINESHERCNEAFKYTLGHAITAGEKLIQAKILCGHGNWEKWHTENINHTIQTSRTYINFGKYKEFILANRKNFFGLTLQQARKLLPDYRGVLSSERYDWYTPKIYIDAVHEVMGGIDLDPASCAKANEVVKANEFYTEENNGLEQSWYGRVFLNPPYGKLGPEFIEKFFGEPDISEAIILVNSRATDASWFQSLFNGIICFTDHRIDFDSSHKKATSSTHGTCFIYFGPNERKFSEIFSRFGNVVRRWPS